jgi:hypothetical protein
VSIVQRFLRAQRVVVIIVTAGVLAALGIGLWPVHADVYGEASYSCGSGFLHSAHRWSDDSQTLTFERTATDNATGTPSQLCPDKVFNRRDLALLVVAFSLAVGLIGQIVVERPRTRGYRSSLFTNRSRRAATRSVGSPKALVEPPGATMRVNSTD